MKRLVSIVLGLIILAGVVQALQPNTYHVSPSGNDKNPGTYLLPLRTIQAGINKAYPGDTVMVLAGTYNEQLTFPRSGTSGFPITVRGEVDSKGNPLAIIDNTTPVTGAWTAAPEVGSGVYKKVGFAPDIMLYNGKQILRISKERMAGDSDYYCDKGFHVLAYPADKVWYPFGEPVPVNFWDDVEVLFGVLNGDTTYIRFRNGDDPDTCALRSTGRTTAFELHHNDYITIEHLRIQGTSAAVMVDAGNHNVIQHNVIRNGRQRVSIYQGSAYNVVRHNYFTLGYGSYGHFGEWGGSFLGDLGQNCASYTLMKYLEGGSSTADRGVQLVSCGRGNEVSNNEMHRGGDGVWIGDAPNTTIRENTISEMSSCGIVILANTESVYVFGNTLAHCNSCIRINDIGESRDTVRSGYIYNNCSYDDSGAGTHVVFHLASGYIDNFRDDSAKPPDFWFYHNSWAGGAAWAGPESYACSRMKVLNNIMSSERLVGDIREEDDTNSTLLESFDHNFLGGLYDYHGYMKFAGKDRHNIWSTDTVNGDINHQVWPLGHEPNWIVPDTSQAYHSGLDLSHPFTLRGVTYGPLPGMKPGYSRGAKPNLGAVQ